VSLWQHFVWMHDPAPRSFTGALASRLVLPGAHAKAGGLWTISGYLGKQDDFDEAMGKFALAYSDHGRTDMRRSRLRCAPASSM
jgi:hypothetical protein